MQKFVTLKAQSTDVEGLRLVLAHVEGGSPESKRRRVDIEDVERLISGREELRSFEMRFGEGQKERAMQALTALYDQSGTSGYPFHITLSDMIRFNTSDESLASALTQLDVVWKAMCE